MRKKYNNKTNNNYIFFIWQDFLHVCILGILPVLYTLEWLKLPNCCEILLWISLAFLSALTLRIVNIDEEGVTIKFILLPIKRKLTYGQIMFIGYKSAYNSESILIKGINYSWWKCIVYRIYMPFIKYQGNEKSVFTLLYFIKKHSFMEISPIGPGAEYLCKKVNDACTQENDII